MPTHAHIFPFPGDIGVHTHINWQLIPMEDDKTPTGPTGYTVAESGAPSPAPFPATL